MGRKRRFRTFRQRKHIVASYRRLGSRKAVARKFGTTIETVTRVLREENEPILSHNEATRRALERAPANRSPFADWLKDHEWVKFRRSPKHFSYASGYSVDLVHSYFKEARRRFKRRLGRIPDLRGVDLVLQDTDGRKWHSSLIREYRYRFDRYTFKARILATMKNGEERVFPIHDVPAFKAIVERHSRTENST